MFKNFLQTSAKILGCAGIVSAMITNSRGMDVTFDHAFIPDPNCVRLHTKLITQMNYQLQKFGHKCSHHTKNQAFTDFKSTLDKSDIGNVVCASCNTRLVRNISSDMYDRFKFDMMDSLQTPMCDKHKDEDKDDYRWKWIRHEDGLGNIYKKDAEADGYIREKGRWNLYGWTPWVLNNNTSSYW